MTRACSTPRIDSHRPRTGPSGGITHDVAVDCLDDRPRLVVQVANAGIGPASIGAWLGYQAEQTAVIDAGSAATFTADNQPPGMTRLRLFLDGLLIADEEIELSC